MINQAALDYMKEPGLLLSTIGKFREHKTQIFSSAAAFERHLQALGLNQLNVTPDPVLIASEAVLWGAIRHQGLMPDTVIVSDDAGQFRVGAHALCWVHAERLVHKLVPCNDTERNAIEIAKRMIWWFYRALKDYKRLPAWSRPDFCAFRRRAGNPAQHQRLGKRHPRLRHEVKNLWRNRQRQSPRCARHHAGAGRKPA